MVWWIIAVFFAFLVKGICGFANTPVMTSILTLSGTLNNVDISPVDLLIGYPANIVMTLRERKSIRWKVCLPLIILVIAGSIPGAIFLKNADTGLIRIIFGFVITSIASVFLGYLFFAILRPGTEGLLADLLLRVCGIVKKLPAFLDAAAVNIGSDNVRGLHVGAVLQQQDIFVSGVHHVAHAHDDQHHDGRDQAGQRDMPHFAKISAAVHRAGLVQFRVDAADGGQEDDGVPSDRLPEIHDGINSAEGFRLCHEIDGFSPEKFDEFIDDAVARAQELDHHTGQNHGRNEIWHVGDGLDRFLFSLNNGSQLTVEALVGYYTKIAH